MTNDARATAWLLAWNRMEAAEGVATQAMKSGAKDEHGTPVIPPAWWAIVAEAQVYATLASAPDVVGFEMGDYLTKRQEEEREREAMIKEHVKKASAVDPLDPSCTCQFDDSQCPVHTGGDDIAEGDDDGPGE